MWMCYGLPLAESVTRALWQRHCVTGRYYTFHYYARYGKQIYVFRITSYAYGQSQHSHSHIILYKVVQISIIVISQNPHVHVNYRSVALYRLPGVAYWDRDKIDAISHTTLSNAFFEWKCLNSDYNLTEVFSEGSKYQYSIIDSDNGLAPSRRQAIIWINGG